MSNSDLEKARQARNAYAREWRKNNPEKAKAAYTRYWARRAEREAQAAEQTMEGGKDHAANTAISENC